jgi:exonuclease III
MDTDKILDENLPPEYSQSQIDSSNVNGGSWEADNLAIRTRHKPPRVLKSGKFTRSNLTIGSLNIAGRDVNMSMHNRNHKFKFLKQMIDDNDLGVLGVQETHFDAESATQFNNIFSRWFKVYHSAHPEKPCSTAGVAFVLNQKILDTENIREYELIPGRAYMIVIPWHKGESLNILNIYGPNRPEERDRMWKALWAKWAEDPQLPFPTIALGDWNFVEDPIDRNSGTIEIVPESFKRLKDLFRWLDGWRVTFPDTRDYTCIQHRNHRQTNEIHDSYSRLDRINVDNQQFMRFRGWEIKDCSVKSDHRLVLTQLTCRPDEQPGRGRWSMPLYLLKTRKFLNHVQSLASELLKDVEDLEQSERDPTINIQTSWAKFKDGVTTYGKHCSRHIIDETTRQIRTWRAQLNIIIHDEDMPHDDKSLAIYLLEKKITDRLKEESEKKEGIIGGAL